MPEPSGAPDAEVEVGEGVLTGVINGGVPRAGVTRTGVVSGRLGVAPSNGRSVNSSVSDASALPVGLIGSVPRKMYLNGVSVSTTRTDARDAFRRPIDKIMIIPRIEKPPSRIGRRSSRSKEGWLSIKNQFLL